MALPHDLLPAVDDLGSTPWSGTTYRFTSPTRDPLSGFGAYRFGGRWNPPESFSTIYLAEPREACLAEFARRAEGQAHGAISLRPQLIHTIEVHELQVMDLTLDDALAWIGLAPDDIAAEDRTACQEVGRATNYLGFQGVRAPSATRVGRVIAAFEQRLDPDQLRVTDSEELVGEPPANE